MEFPSDRSDDLKRLGSAAAIVGAVTLVLFSYLWRNIQMSTLRYQISRLNKEKKKLYLDVEKLRLKSARYSRASRIHDLIREKYGFLPVQLSQKTTTLRLPQLEPPTQK